MTSTNKPGSPESVEKPKMRNGEKSIESLLRKAIKKILGKWENSIDPVKVDTLKYPNIYMSIRSQMISLIATDDEYSGISEKDIDALSDSVLASNIIVFAQPLKNARKNLKSYIKKRFANIGNHVSGFDQKFDHIVWYMDEWELSSMIWTGKKRLISFISQKFSISKDILIYTNSDLQSIIDKVGLTTSSSLYKKLSLQWATYIKNGTPPDISLLEELFEYIWSNYTGLKKEICSFFDVSFSLREALDMDLINRGRFKKIVREEMGILWDTLLPKEQKKIEEAIINDDNFLISANDIDTDDIEKQFNSPSMRKILTSHIHGDMNITESERDNLNDTIDITPTIDIDGNMLMHAWFIEKIARESQGKIKNIEKFTPNAVIVFENQDGNIDYLELQNVDVPMSDTDDIGTPGSRVGMRLALRTGDKNESAGTIKDTKVLSYDHANEWLLSPHLKWARVWTQEEFRNKLTNDEKTLSDGKNPINDADARVFDASGEEEVLTMQDLKKLLDEIDPDGKDIPIEEGMTFSAKARADDEWKINDGVWKIVALTGNNIAVKHIRSSDPKDIEQTSFKNFIDAVRGQSFHRIGTLDTNEQLLAGLKLYGVDDHTSIKGSDLMTHVEEDDGHWHHKHVDKKYEFFQSKEGLHIRVGGIKDGFVTFGEFSSSLWVAEVQKRWSDNKLSEKDKKNIYTWQTMSYAEFLQYLAREKLQATTDNLLVLEADNKYKPQDAHMGGSLLSKLWRSWSIADIMKGFGNLTHGIEHYFEKSSKLNASRFALAMGKKLWLPLDIMAQLQADEVGSVKEIIEKYVEKFRNLNWPLARNKILHIMHNKDARPEETAAGILYMLKGYGSLYAEDIKHAQWSESFINGLLNSCGFKTDAQRTAIKKEAWAKARPTLGDEANANPTEEEMIWAFMKLMDGDYEKYPIAGTIVKAMGWPSGYENAWRKDGFEWAYDKWVRQAGALVNPKARADHGLSALMTHEYHTAIGSMESAAGKAPSSAAIQVIPVVWALGWYSQYISSAASQKIKWFADEKWYSFHAFGFLRNHADNETYRHVFLKALEKVGSAEEVTNTKKWIQDLQYHGHDHSDGKAKGKIVKAAVNGLAAIWRKHCDWGLHDMLQGKDMWLTEQANKDPKADEYLAKFSDNNLTASGNDIPSHAQWWNYEYGYVTNPIMSRVVDKKTGKKLRSLDRTLKKVSVNSHKFSFDREDMQERFWTPTVKLVQDLKDKSTDPETTRAQYLQYRKDILEHFSKALSAQGRKDKWWLNALKKQKYYRDFDKMGIDISVIFDDGNIEDIVERSAEADYQRWSNKWKNTTSNVNTVESAVMGIIDPKKPRPRTPSGWSTTPDVHDPDISRKPGTSPSEIIPDSTGSDSY
jgi:hypothetical protein